MQPLHAENKTNRLAMKHPLGLIMSLSHPALQADKRAVPCFSFGAHGPICSCQKTNTVCLRHRSEGFNCFWCWETQMGKCQAPYQVSLHLKHESPDSMTAILFCSAIYKLCGGCRGYFQCMRAVNKNDLRACPTASVENSIANQTCLVSCLRELSKKKRKRKDDAARRSI